MTHDITTSETYSPAPLPRAARAELAEDDLGFSGEVTESDRVVRDWTLRFVQMFAGARFFASTEKFKTSGHMDEMITRALWFKTMVPFFSKKKIARMCDAQPYTVRRDVQAIERWAEMYPLVDEYVEACCNIISDLIPAIRENWETLGDADRFLHWAQQGFLKDREDAKRVRAAANAPLLEAGEAKSARELEAEALVQAGIQRQRDTQRRIDMAVVNNPDSDLRDVAKAKARLAAG